jgi:nitrogenase subunit NifH
MNTKQEMLDALYRAQKLLSDVYHYSQDIENGTAESALGCADTCIYEAIDALENFGG